MFVLCVLAYGVVLRSVCVLSYVMVEKVKSLLRGHWSVFNIYRAFSSSRLVWRLVVGFSFIASRVGVSSVRLVSSSRRRLLVVSVSCPCILFIVYLIVVSRLVPPPRASLRSSSRSYIPSRLVVSPSVA